MGDKLRAVVVDDEERARKRLTRMLDEWHDVEVVAEAGCGADAIAAIQKHGPDLVFLDVQMPDIDGFGVLAQLPRPPRYVVFTTAYDRYAIDAFAIGAIDYLLKPFGEREVARAMERAMERNAEQRFRDGYPRMMASLDKPRWLERIPVSWLKDIVLVPVSAYRFSLPSKAYTPTFWYFSTFSVKAVAASTTDSELPDSAMLPLMSTSSRV